MLTERAFHYFVYLSGGHKDVENIRDSWIFMPVGLLVALRAFFVEVGELFAKRAFHRGESHLERVKK